MAERLLVGVPFIQYYDILFMLVPRFLSADTRGFPTCDIGDVIRHCVLDIHHWAKVLQFVITRSLTSWISRSHNLHPVCVIKFGLYVIHARFLLHAKHMPAGES